MSKLRFCTYFHVSAWTNVFEKCCLVFWQAWLFTFATEKKFWKKRFFLEFFCYLLKKICLKNRCFSVFFMTYLCSRPGQIWVQHLKFLELVSKRSTDNFNRPGFLFWLKKYFSWWFSAIFDTLLFREVKCKLLKKHKNSFVGTRKYVSELKICQQMYFWVIQMIRN